MPGVDLNLSLPSLSDSLSTVVSKTAVALSAIEDDLAAQVVTAELNINAALSMNGSSLTDVSSLQLLAGNAPTTNGSIYYHTDGEFYVRTAAGAIKVTSNGSLNTAAAGGFTGDYGLGTETASYDDASGEFRFTEDTGVYADLVADDVVLNGSSGTVRLGAASAMTDGRSFLVSTLPASGISLLVYDASDSGVKDNNVTRTTNVVKITDLDVSGSILHGNLEMHADLANAVLDTGTLGTGVTSNIPYLTMSVVGRIFIALPIPVGCRLKTVTMVHDRASNWQSFAPMTIYKYVTFPNSVSTVTAAQTTQLGSTESATSLTVSSPAALASGETHMVGITWNSISNRLYHVLYYYDRTS
jgi:hypothetical protein